MVVVRRNLGDDHILMMCLKLIRAHNNDVALRFVVIFPVITLADKTSITAITNTKCDSLLLDLQDSGNRIAMKPSEYTPVENTVAQELTSK